MNVPQILIAAPHSGSGKTTISIGLMASFAKKLHVQAFKCGPDYIDPTYHKLATNRASQNLDTWLMPHVTVKQIWARATTDADLVIAEGVMGLYDGYDALTERGSTAEIAKLLNIPVILVIDVSKMARSVAAIALGCQQYDKDIHIAGVICNKVASDTHARWVREAIEAVDIPVLGCIPRTSDVTLPERHLGLYMAQEHQNQQDLIQQIGDLVTEHVDLEHLMDIASSAPAVNVEINPEPKLLKTVVRIAVARDKAFSFYYEDNLELLRQSGAEVVFFSPLDDKQLPENISGLYLGGGYPELYAETLSQNKSLLSEIRDLIKNGLPTYAECGGLMMLTDTFSDKQAYPLVSVIAGKTYMSEKLTMGYREVTAQRDTLLLQQGEMMRGHEFHYSKCEWDSGDIPSAYTVSPRYDGTTIAEGYAKDNLLASYIHLHFASNPIVANRFVSACEAWWAQLVEVTS